MSERVFGEYTDPHTGRVTFGYYTPQPEPAASSVMDVPQFTVTGTEYLHGKKSKVCRQIPLNHPDAPHTDAMGRCVFQSQREEREFMRKTGATNDGRNIEEGGYELQVDREKAAQKILPHEKEWQQLRTQAREAGVLPRDRSEPKAETARRNKAYKRRRKTGDK